MKPPRPELHTYFDKEQGERVFYACEPTAFDNGDCLVVVGANFLSDGFSIPRGMGLRGFFATAPASLPAAMLHDWLYKTTTPKQGMTRRDIDRLFLNWLKAYGGIGIIRRRLIYWGVRAGGGLTSYNKKNASFYQGKHHD